MSNRAFWTAVVVGISLCCFSYYRDEVLWYSIAALYAAGLFFISEHKERFG